VINYSRAKAKESSSDYRASSPSSWFLLADSTEQLQKGLGIKRGAGMIMDYHVHVWRYPDHFIRDVLLKSQPARRKNWSDEQFKAIWDTPIESYLKEAEGIVDKAILVGLNAPNTFGIYIPLTTISERLPANILTSLSGVAASPQLKKGRPKKLKGV